MIVVDASAVLETLPAGIYDKGNGLSGQFALQKIMRHTCRLYRQRDDKHHRAEQGRRQSGRQEWQGQEPVERKPDDHRERPTKRRPNDDLRGIYRAIHGGILNPGVLVHVTLQITTISADGPRWADLGPSALSAECPL